MLLSVLILATALSGTIAAPLPQNPSGRLVVPSGDWSDENERTNLLNQLRKFNQEELLRQAGYDIDPQETPPINIERMRGDPWILPDNPLNPNLLQPGNFVTEAPPPMKVGSFIH